MDIVRPPESRCWYTVSKREGGDTIVLVVEEMEGVVGRFLGFSKSGFLVGRAAAISRSHVWWWCSWYF